MDDRRLLDAYVESGCERAFSEIVRRHVDLVYATCRRRLVDAHLAEDAAQAVFIVLARRARTIARGRPLVAWLHQTACYVSANAVRLAAIRRKHEMRAAQDAKEGFRTRAARHEAEVPIDEALEKLGEVERSAVLLHYVEGRTH